MASPLTSLHGTKSVSSGAEQAIQWLSERVWIGFVAAAYVGVILYFYANFTVKVFNNGRYTWNPNWDTIVYGSATVVMLAVCMPTRIQRPGDLGLWVLFIVALVPGTIVPSALLRVDTGTLVGLQVAMGAGFGLLLLANSAPTFRIDLPIFTPRGYSFFLLVVFAVFLLPLIVFTGIPTSLPSFRHAYVARTQLIDSLQNAPFFVGYLWGIFVSAIIPLMVAYGVTTRNTLPVFFGGAGVIYTYALSGAKSVIFVTAVVLLVMLLLRILGTSLPLLIGPGIIVLFPLMRGVDFLLPVPWGSALVDRALLVPGSLTGRYLEYFSTHQQGHWADSLLFFAYDYPYDRPLARIIGLEYYLPDTEANTHMWADGYANFGIGGVLFVSLVAAILLYGFNCVAEGRNSMLVIPLAVAAFYSMASSSVLTLLLTHGVGILLVLSVLVPSEPIRHADECVAGTDLKSP